MGGRGSGSGISSNQSSFSSTPAYALETEKAIRMKLSVEDYTLDQERSRYVWVPKSQLSENGVPGEWITEQKTAEFYQSGMTSPHKSTWIDENGKEYAHKRTASEQSRFQQRQYAYNAGRQSYNELIAEAKRRGVKGVCVGMKRSTIERKLAQLK